MNIQSLFLSKLKTTGEVLQNQPMSQHTTFRIGGNADVFIIPKDEKSLLDAVTLCREYNTPFFILGNGSNLLVSDNGIEGVVISTEMLKGITVNGLEIEAECGAMLAKVAYTAQQNSLTGLEFASGIPGTLGGAVYMNAGAYGEEMKGIIQSVRVICPSGEVNEYVKENCAFSYRTSIFQQQGGIILCAKMLLTEGIEADIAAKSKRLNKQRQEKQPIELPSAGSVFKRPPGGFAGTLIEQAGLKGFTIGGAQVSQKHAGFIVNTGGASAKDVLELVAHIKAVVKDNSGVELEEEIRLIGRPM